ncbi:MAG: hypothetical protein ACMXYF_04360 [Candidatus Woesearchaeota archaeon]
MTQPTPITEEPITIYEAKSVLKSIKKRDEELSFRSQKTDEYIKENTPLTEKAAKELKTELLALEIPRFKEDMICKIIDVMPLNVEDIKIVLSGYNLTIKQENLKAIDDVLAKFR